MQSLQVGDKVCDCRFLHLKIISIEERWRVRSSKFLRAIVFAELLPMKFSDWLWDNYCLLCRKFNYLELDDKDLELEDGNCCSAMYCCDPIDHIKSHTNEQKSV